MNAPKDTRCYAATALAAALTLAVTFGAPERLDAASVRTSANQDALVMSVGGRRVVNLPAAMSDVVIANPEVVAVHVRSNTPLYIIAKGQGDRKNGGEGKSETDEGGNGG